MRLSMSREVAAQVLLVVVLLDAVTAHVRLTYPPGRYIDLDFLDNARTTGPCGVPQKDTDEVTKLMPGQSFNTTWHLSYSHMGGYQLQLLQGSDVVRWLTTANEWLGQNDVSSQNHMVTIPSDFECDQCTLRLLRQASEWGQKYRFWSCAEVSIKKDNAIDCSGHPVVNGQCQCGRLYSGTYCQYKDDCVDDSDCSNNGKCIDIEATSYPKRQCFCDMGYFGQNCQKVSPVKSVDFSPDDYTKKSLATGYNMFYRVIEESQELEVILQAEGTTWLGIGWRPHGYGPNCRRFPDITGKAGGAGHAELTGEPEGEAHPKGAPEGEGKAEGEPEGHGKAEGEPEEEGHAEGTAEGTAEPESGAHPEVKSEGKAEPEGGAHPEATAEPEGGAHPKVKAEGKAEPEGGAHPEATAEPEGGAHPKVKAEGTAEPEGGAHPEVEAEGKAEPEGGAHPEGTAEPEGGAHPNVKAEGTAEPEGGAHPEVEAEGKAEPEGGANPEGTAEPEGGAHPNVKAEGTAEPEGEAHPEVEAEGTAEPEGGAHPKVKAEGTAEPEGGAHPEVKAEGKAEPEGGAHPESTAEGTAEPEGGAGAEPETGGTGEFHAMDCTDIIVGAARGDRSRILDYYTRDRATPRQDEVYGGTQGLTAAVGREASGRTTLLFRRKLVSTERTDYTITEKAMHLIFARGQQQGNYIHSPLSGYEQGNSKDANFYHTDELKYHGHQSQRGALTIEFMPKRMATDVCFAGYKMPSSCTDTDCDYKATWVLNEADDTVTFTIVAKQDSNTWTGIGFGKGRDMDNLDVVLGWMNGDQGKVIDGWIGPRQALPVSPVQDRQQDLMDESISYANGRYTLKFTRKRNTEDSQDYQFSDSNSDCYTGFFVTNGGRVVNGFPGQHFSVPSRPEKKFCIRKCEASVEKAVVSLRIHREWDNQYSDVNNDKSKAFIQTWLPVLTDKMIKKVPNIVDVQVRSLRRGSVVADLDVTYATSGAENEAIETRMDIDKAVMEEVQDKELAGLRVDPTYVRVVEEHEFIPEAATSELRRELEEIEIILIVIICVLVLVALIVMMVKCVEASRNGEELCGISFAGRRQNYSIDKKNGLFKSSTKF